MLFLSFSFLSFRAFDLRLTGREFDPRPWRYRVTALDNLLTPMCLCQQAAMGGDALFGWEGNRGPDS